MEHSGVRYPTAKDLLVENINDESRENLRSAIRVRYQHYCVRHPDQRLTAEEYTESMGYSQVDRMLREDDPLGHYPLGRAAA